jgi:methyl-accepting chemotaxis protein
MMRGSREVTIEMRKLSDMTKIVNSSMSGMSSRTGTISQTVQAVLAISQKTLESINTVLEDLNKFKVGVTPDTRIKVSV